MIVQAPIAQKFTYIRPYLQEVGARVKDLVLAYCEKEGFAFVARYKSVESVAEKIETGRFSRWSQLEDIFACTIVVPTLVSEISALSFLNSVFYKVVVRSRGSTQNDPNVFRFDSTRFVGKLKRPEGREVNENLQSIVFEVQIRTAFEHAWSVTTHALAYKGQKIDWKTLRLAAQLKAAVEQLDNLIVGFNEVARSISEQHWPEIQVKKRIEEFFAEQLATGMVPTEMKPDSWTRFCDNVYALLRSSEGAHEKRPHQLVEPAITALSEEIQRTTPEKFPRSISLTQFVIGVLMREKIVSPPFHRYIPLITEPLPILYPEVQGLTDIFDLELTNDY